MDFQGPRPKRKLLFSSLFCCTFCNVRLGISPDIFIYLAVPDEILVERVVGRRSDPITNKIYHVKFNPPPEDPEILERLTQRKDDTEEVIISRLEQFHANIGAVQDNYRDKLIHVNGNQDKRAVFAEIEKGVEGKVKA